jgi:hypothetical protein
LKGVTIDTENDESTREEKVRKFKVTNISESRDGHDDEIAIAPTRDEESR